MAGFFLLAVQPGAAQEPLSEGETAGNYNVQQTLEFGGRFVDTSGNSSVYNTFVNLDSGVRLYEHTLSMRSLNHQGLLFDNLYVSSFGYGGDPNNATRLRMYKNRWYNFSASFRRDRNLWNYNLFANPLNPTTSDPSLIITDSLHRFDTVRRMSDFRLTLLPQSRVRVRLGYSRNVSEGPSFSSFHEGTDYELFQDWKATTNSYQFGFDFRVLPRTNFSYDQFLNYYKGDTSWEDQNFDFMLSNGVPVDLGIIFNTEANQPCATPVPDPDAPTTAYEGCNAFLSYSRAGRPRVFQPTEQFSFESSYFRNLNMAGRVSYSAGDNEVLDYEEIFSGNVTRTRQRGLTASGTMNSRRVSTTVDWAATYIVTPKLRFVDDFRFSNFRRPGVWDVTEMSLFPQAPLLPDGNGSMLLPPGEFTPESCPPPFTAPTCPQHNSRSSADFSVSTQERFLGQNTKYNTFQVQYDFTPRFGARLGYRYGHRRISTSDSTFHQSEIYYPGPTADLAFRGDCALEDDVLPEGCTLQADGSVIFMGFEEHEHEGEEEEHGEEVTIINEHSALLGLWARPVDGLRMSFDLELFSADHSFTRISPRNLQHYKFRLTYSPGDWMTLGGTVNVLENRNNVPDVGNRQHYRTYGFNVMLEPDERFGLDFGYEYNDILSMSQICFASSEATSSLPCPVSGGAPILGISEYATTIHFGHFSVRARPLPRLTATAGYSIDSATGSAPILDPVTRLPLTVHPNVPAGPLQHNYHRPYAGLAIELARGLTWNGRWGYYDYREKALPDPTGPRSFTGNVLDLTLRYSF